MRDGLLVIDKPRGMSSHDVVNRVRRTTHVTRAGHAGTLDPLASGVLMLCLGQATRLAEYLGASDKTYLAELRLGQQTPSYDCETPVSEERPWQHLTLEDLESALPRFIGEIAQVPPMYSAVKLRGKPLYKMARRGISVAREARQVTIYALEVVRWEPPLASLRVHCSSGTYIRSLAHDLGQALGCGAYMAGLVRESAGAFTLAEAIALDALSADNWQTHLLPMQTGLSYMRAVQLDEAGMAEVRHGRRVSAEDVVNEDQLGYALAPDGDLVAILRYVPEAASWQPIKVLAHD
ncbi:MAG: tRNA pseudouridine(55) synthase TruB [Chloroflexi bacterium]|nr:tRNA pseudouridine(55) synthase TruB [Chloroflexota bacterium]